MNANLKPFVLPLLLMTLASGAMGQGQIIFHNRVAHTVVAPVYDFDPGKEDLAKKGNSSSGVPSGGQQYFGLPLSGTGYSAQLFGGPVNASVDDLVALTPVAAFEEGAKAGFIVPPTHAVVVPGVTEGEPAKFILRIWQNPGSIGTWIQAKGTPRLVRGESLPFISPPLGGTFTPPPNLVGLQSFNLSLPSLPFPRLSASAVDEGVEVLFTAETNRTYTVQASADLIHWTDLQTNIFVPSSPWAFRDHCGASTNKFYRLVVH